MAEHGHFKDHETPKNYIEKVAIVGAGGNCGRFMTESLLKTGKHTVTAITRPESTSVLPDGVLVKKVDYSHQASLVDALKGQDALIITMGVMAPKDQISALIHAAAQAGVPWVLPNDWAPDLADESLGKEALIGEASIKHRSLISQLGRSSWISVSTGFWYEWSLAIKSAFGFDFEKREVTFFDDGKTEICTSTWPQVGRGVAALLSLKIRNLGERDTGPCLDNFRNKFIYISSFTVSQEKMLDSVLRVSHTKLEDWTISREPVKERYAAGMKQLQSGDREGFVKVLYSRIFFPDGSGNVEKTRGLQNDVLGLPKEDIDESTKVAIERSKIDPFNQ